MVSVVTAKEFLKLRNSLPVIDTRSPIEFLEGHIPNAINMALFSDEERRVVGTIYKNSGKEAAVLEGLGFAGLKLKDFVKQARRIAPSRKLLLHCWRGGMRSESMAWLLSTAGFEVYLLAGGYKAYRKYIRESWANKCRLVVISGKTGSGKTDVLKELSTLGHQTLDLEFFAHHKGSAFGAIGEENQPTNEQFENNLADKWLGFDFDRPIWIEDESRFIGKVTIPEPLFMNKQKALTIRVEIPRKQRIDRLVREYANTPAELLIQSIKRITPRLGGQHAKAAIQSIEVGDFASAIDVVLTYYDKTYTFDLEKKMGAKIVELESESSDPVEIAQMLIRNFDSQ